MLPIREGIDLQLRQNRRIGQTKITRLHIQQPGDLNRSFQILVILRTTAASPCGISDQLKCFLPSSFLLITRYPFLLLPFDLFLIVLSLHSQLIRLFRGAL